MKLLPTLLLLTFVHILGYSQEDNNPTTISKLKTECTAELSYNARIQNAYRESSVSHLGSLYSNNLQIGSFFDGDSRTELFSSGCIRGIWATGNDPSGNLKLSASTYPQGLESDYSSGPLFEDVSLFTPEHCAYYNRAWVVTEVQISYLRRAYNEGTLKIEDIPVDILEWPGKNNPHVGNLAPTEDIAPFYDNNGDEVYNPLDGDYPLALKESSEFLPHEFRFYVFNDNTVHVESQGAALGMEYHVIDFVVNCQDPSESEKTIFTRIKYINKSKEDIRNLKLGIWNDANLGCLGNDFVGCSQELNANYIYNSNGVEDPASNLCAGETPVPEDYGIVQSLIYLNQNMQGFMPVYRQNSSSGPATTDPQAINQYVGYLNNQWLDGSPLTTGGTGYNPGSTDVTSFAYPDMPTDFIGWSLQQEGLTTLSARTLTNFHNPILRPEESGILEFADYVLLDKENLGLSIFDIYEKSINSVKNDFLKMKAGTFECGAKFNICTEECVWPGDVNNDGLVTGKDIVLIGNFLGAGTTEGLARPVKSTEWLGWESSDWQREFVGTNGKYADATGNGLLNTDDILATQENFGLNRTDQFENIILEEKDEAVKLSLSYLFGNYIDLEILEPIPFLATEFKIYIILGEHGEELNEPLHGLSFEVNFDTSLIAIPEAIGGFQGRGFVHPFFNYNSESYDNQLDEYTGDNKVSIALTNDNGSELSDSRTIATFSIRVKENGRTNNVDRRDTVVMKFSNVFATNAEGDVIELGASYDTLFIDNLIYDPNLTSNTSEITSEQSFYLYPNPVSENLHIRFNEATAGTISITNLEGQKFHDAKIKSNSHIYDTSTLASGMYLAIFRNEGGETITKKFVKIK